MKPVIITKGRFRLIISGDSVALDIDGSGLSVMLTDDEKIQASRALWYAAKGR